MKYRSISKKEFFKDSCYWNGSLKSNIKPAIELGVSYEIEYKYYAKYDSYFYHIYKDGELLLYITKGTLEYYFYTKEEMRDIKLEVLL